MGAWLDKNPALVTDNASNMTIASELAKLVHVKCFANSLNLAAQRALKVPTVARLLGRSFSEKHSRKPCPVRKAKTSKSPRTQAHDIYYRYMEQRS